MWVRIFDLCGLTKMFAIKIWRMFGYQYVTAPETIKQPLIKVVQILTIGKSNILGFCECTSNVLLYYFGKQTTIN